MFKAAILKVLSWSSNIRAKLALVLMLTIVIAGLQGHVTSEHAAASDTQAIALDDGHDHSHDEPDGDIQHSGHDHSQDAVDHSHQFSLMADHVSAYLPVFSDVRHLVPELTIKGIDLFDIDKPPKLAAHV
jgi:hypothetical protein